MIPLPAVYRSVDFSRYAPTIDSAGFSLFSAGKSSRSSSWSFIIDIVEVIQQYPLTRDLVHDKILLLAIKPKAPLPLCGCEYVLSVWTVRDRIQVDTRQEPTQILMNLSLLLDRV